ncbi:adenylate/guanylate cyclase domain-containing protein [Azospirillum canadense]|uniref:adenylate/guanylate cyclase domain-containing protein n=1 Tax=Azospirillum canadense TaxID=403962 RepID=UPI002227AC92|nr:adenylate/guanylate cyclase domain-containing protein [Azospirillum canadense]MCW2243103.1 adenylate cyclase [Azospirillum canadense]
MRVRVSYQLSITLMVGVLVLGVGLGLVILSFDRARSITRSAALTFIERVAEHTADRVDGEFKGVLDTLEVLATLPAITSSAIANNPPLYAVMAALLRRHAQLYNLYVGYDDGAYLELNDLSRVGDAARGQMGTPPDSAFRLAVIGDAQEQQTRAQVTQYLSAGLAPIASTERETDYDPRGRPWYRTAIDDTAGAVTAPYVSVLTALPGYTVRLPFQGDRHGVVAGNILLADIGAFLRAQQLGASGVVLLFDDNGRVVAHPRMASVLHQRAPGGQLELPHLDQMLDVDITPPLNAWMAGGAAEQIFSRATDGRTYVAAFRSVPSAGSAHLRLAVVAPLDEFFAAVEAGRRRLVLLALGVVLGTLPVVWWIGSRLSRSMKDLARETERIQNFETASPRPEVRSLIREIDDLGRSVATMRTVVLTFARFVPKRLVQQLVTTGAALRLGGTRREVTILFTDIEGFTAITEKAAPEQVMNQTSRYLGVLSAAIMEHGGTVDKFIGDAVMAIWNAPADDPDHVAHACAAVLACRTAIQQLNAAFEQEGWPAYRTRFGLHTGEAVVGTIGSADRMAYTVLGATVNLAARLEPLNKDYGTDILVSAAVAECVSDRFVFRVVDTVLPRGLQEPIGILELCAARDLVSSTRPIHRVR